MVCVRTSDGFVAVLTPALSAPNSLAEIFSGLVRERQAMSRHLHNALTQDLVALSLSLSGIAADSGESLSSAVAHIDRCCRGVRALTYVLSPPAFLNAGLIETIEWYGDVLRADAGVHFVLDPGTLPADPPEPIKELLFAALQHVAATAIWQPGGAVIRLSIRYLAGSILMRIECACRSDEPLRESPLVRERARTLGGVTRFSSAIGNASLEVSIPWSPDAVPQSSSQ